MIAVTVEYRPLGILWKRRLDAKLPARWSEMTPAQIIAIPELQRNTLDEPKLLEIFLGIKRSVAKRIDSYQRYCILRNLKYIQDPEPVSKFMIPKILCFRAPGDHLKNITFGAFIFGDTYFQNYMSGKKEEDLNRFIACFYYNKCGFVEADLERNARLIGLTDIVLREAIAINYMLIREWLAKMYTYVFQKAEEGKKQDKTGGWVAVFDHVVGDDIANQEKYEQQPLSTILRYLNRKTKELYKNGSKVQRPG